MATLKELVTSDIREFFRLRGAMQVAPMLFNEKEFQMCLVAHLRESSAQYDDVFMEYHLPLSIFKEHNKESLYPWKSSLYLDIVVLKDNEYIPIELKYKLTATNSNVDRFGVSISHITKSQGAQDLGCYGYWKDVKRVECIRKIFTTQVKDGLAIFLTNDKNYWQGTVAPKSMAKKLSLSENVERTTEKHWQNIGASEVEKKYPSFDVDKSYEVNWNDAYTISAKNNNKFRYFMVEI